MCGIAHQQIARQKALHVAVTESREHTDVFLLFIILNIAL
jgi:hypothetical protein